MHTHPSVSADVRRGFRFGKNANRNPSRGLLVGVSGSVGDVELGLRVERSRRGRGFSGASVVFDENVLADGDGEQGDEDSDMGEFGVTFSGVDGVELVEVLVTSPSKGRRLRRTRLRRGRNGHEPVGETHSFGSVHSGTGRLPEMRVPWAAPVGRSI